MPGKRKLTADQAERLRDVAARRQESDTARADLNESIRAAADTGCSLRAISEAAGMSYQRVHQILKGD